MLLILSDKTNLGKSKLAQKAAHIWIDNGKQVNGFITPAAIKNGRKIGHDFVPIVRSKFGKRIPFSRLNADEDTIKVGRYYLRHSVFQMAEDIPLSGNFIIDEIGTLEIKRNAGFLSVLNRAIEQAETVLVVVQKRVLTSFIKLFRAIPLQVFSIWEMERHLTEEQK